jgi:hypothetical protein
MNTAQQNARLLELRTRLAEREYLAQIARHSTHALTLQTSLKTYNASPTALCRHVQQARTALHKFRLRFNRATTGNGWRRNPSYVPVFVPVLEGTMNTYDRARTLHFHCVLGNLPARLGDEALASVTRRCWLATEVGADDIVLVPLTPHRKQEWTDYMTKERDRGNVDCVDYYNAQLPAFLCA